MESEPARGWLATASRSRCRPAWPASRRCLDGSCTMASTCGASSDGLGRAGGRGRRGGVAAAAAAHFTVVPGWGWFAAILALGVLDATLGYVAGVTFVGAATLAGHLAGANEVRLAMGVVLVWFAVPLERRA